MELIEARTSHMLNLTAAQSLNALPVLSDVELHAWTEQVLERSDDSLRRYLLDSDTALSLGHDGLLSPTKTVATFNLSQMLSPPPSPVNEFMEVEDVKSAPVIKTRDHLDSTCCVDIDTSYEELLNFVGIEDIMQQPLSPEEVDSTLQVEVVEEVVEEVVSSSPCNADEDWHALQQELEYEVAVSPERIVDLLVSSEPVPRPFNRRKQMMYSFLAASPSSDSETSSGGYCSPPPTQRRKPKSSGRVRKEKPLLQKEKKRLSNRESAARYREKVKALKDAEEKEWCSVECENVKLREACRQARDEEKMLVELLRQVEKLRQKLQVAP